jgi:hypothetical protein
MQACLGLHGGHLQRSEIFKPLQQLDPSPFQLRIYLVEENSPPRERLHQEVEVENVPSQHS